jgi:hypothetical protein
MKIAVLGWGSLIWDARDLALATEFLMGMQSSGPT